MAVAAARREAFWQLVRYGVNGGIATVFHVSVYWILVRELHRPPQIGNLFGYLAAVLTGYFLHSKLTFRAHGARNRGTQLRFVAASLLSYLLNALWTWVCTALLAWPTWTPLVPIACLTPFLMFAVNRWWVFR
jgi:putative flippase GtrA